MTSSHPTSTRADLQWFVLAMIPFGLLAVRQWGWAPPASAGDYAQYLLHAKSIVDGRPYADIGYIFHPDAWTIGPRAYPPGLPLTLAPIVAVAGVHSMLVRLLMLASTIVFAWLAWRRLSRESASWQAAVGVGFAALAIEARGGTLAPISDPGFAALMWATVLTVDSATQWSWRRILAVTAFGGGALAYRLTGVAVVGAFAIYVLVTWRGHRGRAAVPLLLWGVGGLLALGVGVMRLGDVATILTGLGATASRLPMLVSQYRLAAFEMALYPTASSSVNLVYHAVTTLLMAVGVVVLAQRSWRSFLAVVCVVYVVMLLSSPVSEERYLWPLYPVGACALAVGLTSVLERVVRWRPSFPAVRLAVLSLVVAGASALVSELRRDPPRPLVGTPDAQELFAWLRDASRTSPMRIAFSNPRVVTLETGVPGMGNVQRTPPGHLLAYDQQRITHLIWQRPEDSDCLQRMANELPAMYPDRFALVHENSTFRVYRLLPRTAPPDSSFRRLSWREIGKC